MIKRKSIEEIFYGDKSDEQKIDELKQLLHASGKIENEFLELKQNSPENLIKQFSAFTLQENGGFLIIGITNDYEIIGISRKKIDELNQKIDNQRKNQIINVYSFFNEIKYEDIVQYNEIKVSKDKFLVMFDFKPKPAFIWIGGDKFPKLYHRMGESSFPSVEGKDIFNIVIKKYDYEKRFRIIQKTFNYILRIVKYNYIDSNFMKSQYRSSFSEDLKFSKKFLADLPKEYFQELNLQYSSTYLTLNLNNNIYHIPLNNPFNFSSYNTKNPDSSYCIRYLNEKTIGLTTLEDVKKLFKDYCRFIQNFLKYPIKFEENLFPSEKDLILEVLDNPKDFNKYNVSFLPYISRQFQGMRFNKINDNTCKLEYEGKDIFFEGDKIRIVHKTSDKSIIDSIKQHLLNKGK